MGFSWIFLSPNTQLIPPHSYIIFPVSSIYTCTIETFDILGADGWAQCATVLAHSTTQRAPLFNTFPAIFPPYLHSQPRSR